MRTYCTVHTFTSVGFILNTLMPSIGACLDLCGEMCRLLKIDEELMPAGNIHQQDFFQRTFHNAVDKIKQYTAVAKLQLIHCKGEWDKKLGSENMANYFTGLLMKPSWDEVLLLQHIDKEHEQIWNFLKRSKQACFPVGSGSWIYFYILAFWQEWETSHLCIVVSNAAVVSSLKRQMDHSCYW